ncbi:MAG: FAD-dependent oxidoreductase [Pseudomonadota bacterium]|nr:FAD-dependent oxidoreductase [Pseudomonadota bacterium]
MSRRSVLVSASAALAAPALVRAQSLGSDERTVVVGAGAFGAWTAEKLREAGGKVLLLDAWGPGHARASSGGESRMTRGAYGASEIYTRMALESLTDWRRLSDQAGLPLFHQTGVLFFFPRVEPYLTETTEVHRRLALGTELLDAAALRSRFPMIDFTGIEAGVYEPQFGVLMARRAIQTLVERYVPIGGLYERAAVAPPGRPERDRLRHVTTLDGNRIEADRFVFACGPWLPKLFPDLLGGRIFPTRQEVFFFATPPGDVRFLAGRLPGWADFNNGDIYYGFPDLENRGFKIAHDAHGPRIDLDTIERTPTAEELRDVRAYMERRFPALAGQPLNEARVCQYENSSNGDLLIDFHPQWRNVLLVGAGSGHGFKHGPAVGRYAAELLTGRLERPEPRFSLASKAETQNRAVH